MENISQDWPSLRDPREKLSAREAEVLAMASLGLTNSEIAGRLHVTVHAVKFHLAGVYRKLEVANRTEAAAVYLTGRLSDRRELA
jgi:DNA-binding NarL/FixJ family response regulator